MSRSAREGQLLCVFIYVDSQVPWNVDIAQYSVTFNRVSFKYTTILYFYISLEISTCHTLHASQICIFGSSIRLHLLFILLYRLILLNTLSNITTQEMKLLSVNKKIGVL